MPDDFPATASTVVAEFLNSPMQPNLREALGRRVRGVWIQWAKEQPNPKPSWLVPWAGLGEPDKEVDRRIGEELYRLGQSSMAPVTPSTARSPST